ncbi:MAG TPA: cytochrome c [Solirubrobacterales bacterium]|jgi:mono/diheme cytochrome c family protein|nr:cytochrome c [Solirubrobacterales bacterium]
MEETLFYVCGIALVVCALAVTAVGLRWEGFPPSRGVLAGIIVVFAGLVGATATFAWMNAEEEQSEHAAEHAEERAAAAEEARAEEQEALAVEEGTAPPDEAAASLDGAQVFESAGCSGCHTLAAAGSTATTGPDLDGALQGKSKGYIEEAIVDPNKNIAAGYPPDVMPQDFGESLSPEELKALVDYLAQST